MQSTRTKSDLLEHHHTELHTSAHTPSPSSKMIVGGWNSLLQLCIMMETIRETSGEQHALGILLPWSANLIGYSGFTSNGTDLYSYSGFGSRAHTAITLAFAAVKKDETLLQEVRELTWVWHDDGCDTEKSIFATVQLILEYGVKGIVGPSCAEITDTVAKVAFYHDVPVIGYSIPSFTRSTRSDLPNLIRTIAPFSSLGESVVGLMRAFDWKRVAILFESGDPTGWEGVATNIEETVAASNLTFYSTYILSPSKAGTAASTESVSKATSAIKELGYRIILIIGSCESIPKVGYELYQNSMLEGYAIITMSSLSDMNCEVTEESNAEYFQYLNLTLFIDLEWPTGSQADKFEYNALNAYYSFEQYQTPPNGTAKRTGANKGGFNPFNLSYEYASQVSLNTQRLYKWQDEWGYVSYLYDSILLYARALNYTLNNGINSTYQTFKSTIPKVTPFAGAWRSVEFNTTGATIDRVLNGRVYELFMYNKTVAGVPEISVLWPAIASQNSSGFFLLKSKDSITWPGPSLEVPVDFVNTTLPCDADDVDSKVSKVSASTLSITVSYVYKEGTSCDKGSYDFPSEQILHVGQFPLGSVIGVVALMCASLGTIICTSITLFALYFRNHSLLVNNSLTLTLAWLALTLLAASSPLFFLGTPSPALCQARSFALILPGFMLSSFMIAKIYSLASMISASRKKKHYPNLILCKFFALCNSPVWLLLIIGSAYNPPSSFSEYVHPSNAPLTIITNFGCENINVAVFTALLLYLAIMVLYGFWISSRILGQIALAASLWKSSTRVWEIRFLTYCTKIVLLGQVGLLMASLYKDRTGLDLFRVVSSITISIAASVSLSVKWIPRMAIVLNENMFARDPSDEQDSSPSNTANAQASGVADNYTQNRLPQSENELFQIPQRASHGTGFKRSCGTKSKSDNSAKDSKQMKITVEKDAMTVDISAPPSPSTARSSVSTGTGFGRGP